MESSFGTKGERELSIYLLNIRSLRSNLTNLIGSLHGNGERPHVLVLTETWIYSWEEQLYTVDGYTAYFNSRGEGQAGGVAIYVRDDINSYHISNVTANCEACVVGVEFADGILPIVGVYRSPTATVSDPVEFILNGIESSGGEWHFSRPCLAFGHQH